MSKLSYIISSIIDIIGSIFGGKKTNNATTYKRPFYTTQFLLAGQTSERADNTLEFFDRKNHSDSDRQWYLDFLKDNDYNSLLFFIVDANDGPITPYKNYGFGGEFDETFIDCLKKWRDKMENAGITPLPLLMCDESTEWSVAKFGELPRLCEKVVPLFPRNPWIAGLEVEEYWDGQTSVKVAGYIQKYTLWPVGVHTTKIEYATGDESIRRVKFLKDIDSYKKDQVVDMKFSQVWPYVKWKPESVQVVDVVSPDVDFVAYEWGGDPWKDWNNYSPEQVYDDTRRLLSNMRPGKLLFPCEFSVGRKTDRNKLQGLAAAFSNTSKIIGVGSGAPAGLWKFMRNLPEGMDSTRSGNIITMSGQGKTTTADIGAGTFK